MVDNDDILLFILVPQMLDYTSNHFQLCSLIENMVNRKKYATTEALDDKVCYPCVKM